MLSQKINSQIALIAYATVSDLFATFHNPKMRGENFTWEKFPNIVEGIVAAQVFCNVVCKDEKKQKLAEEQGRKFAHEIAERMVKAMTK